MPYDMTNSPIDRDECRSVTERPLTDREIVCGADAAIASLRIKIEDLETQSSGESYPMAA